MRTGELDSRTCKACGRTGLIWGERQGNKIPLIPAKQGEDGLWRADPEAQAHACGPFEIGNGGPKWSKGQKARYGQEAARVNVGTDGGPTPENYGEKLESPAPPPGKEGDEEDSDGTLGAEGSEGGESQSTGAPQNALEGAQEAQRATFPANAAQALNTLEALAQKAPTPEEQRESEAPANPAMKPLAEELWPHIKPKVEAMDGTLAKATLGAMGGIVRRQMETDAALSQAIRQVQALARVAQVAPAKPQEPQETVIILREQGKPDRKLSGEWQHPQLGLLTSLVAAGKHAYLHGAPGGGKSTAALMVAESLGREFRYTSLTPQTPDSRMMGFIRPDGTFTSTVFEESYTKGHILCIDEADNASGALLTALNSALANGRASFPYGMAEKHPDFGCIATGNTAGYGGSVLHPDRRPLDSAFRDRFFFIAWEYDGAFERKLALARNSGAGAWVNWVQKVRTFAKSKYPRLVVSPRASLEGADLLGRPFMTVSTIAEGLVWRGIDRDTVSAILAACPYPEVKFEAQA